MTATALSKLCLQHQAIIVREDDHTLYIAVAQSPGEPFLNALRFASNKQIHVACWPEEQLEKARQSQAGLLPVKTTGQDTAEDGDPLDEILSCAITRRASDIHIEPGAEKLAVRLRVDGVLHLLHHLPSALAAPLLARLKVSAGLDIAERRLPQDGQFSARISATDVTLRVSTLPCHHGEKAVLRVQALQPANYCAEVPGMSGQQKKRWQHALDSPQGLILVTGPTGSGKTRTLYAGLHALNHIGVNICSAEDPIEIPIAGINQTQINIRAGLDFPLILRALLRQDPDIIMIGEIRDMLTADIAIKAAQTGHLVLSTLHTNSTTDTITRLQNMGIPGWMLASVVRLIVAQRLVRRLCPHCRQPAKELARVNHPDDTSPDEGITHWLPAGCQRCYAGYYGRLALFEMLPPDPLIRQAISQGADSATLTRLAKESGYPNLLHSATHAIRQGLTTVSEVWRVIGDN